MRSLTAERIYRHDRRFEVRSAGISENARVRVNEEHLLWADYIVCMEDRHRDYVEQHFAEITESWRIMVLDIPDIYRFMDRTLVRELRERFERRYRELRTLLRERDPR
jgi:protein-tyrosine phosphatase